MSPIMRKLYRQARKAPATQCWVGYAAVSALNAARTLRRWDALESMGLVRLRSENDPYWEPGCSCGVKNCPNNDPDAEAYGVIGEYCLPHLDAEGYWCAEGREDSMEGWACGVSVWGHVGYRDVLDWRENAHILGIMDEAIEAFRDAWKARQRRHGKRRESPAVA